MPLSWKLKTRLLLIAYFVGSTRHAVAALGDNSVSGNLAKGRTLSASSTCGSTQPERFCAQPSSNTECAVCDLSHPDSAHPPSHMIDEDSVSEEGERTWWQSEGGTSNVTIQLDLENTFLFTHILMLFKSSVPAAMSIDKSVDFGSTYQVLQHFSTDCQYFFGLPDTPSGTSSSDVICTSSYQEGEVLYLAFPPPTRANFSNAAHVARAKLTNLRVRLLAFSRNDLPDPQKHHYAVYHLEVWGRCFCNGNAEQCLRTTAEMADGGVPSSCQCINGTDGTNCERCLPLYNNQDPQDGSCTKCECNGHASSCHYDSNENGGVCDDCADGTAGSKCERCQEGFYRNPSVPITDRDACLACTCNSAGTVPETFCAEEDGDGKMAGQCNCKNNTVGKFCDQCKDGFFRLNEADPVGCQACSCDNCDNKTGRCRTDDGSASWCPPDQYYDGISCQECGCSEHGSFGVCDLTGACICRPGFGGRQCDGCLPGFYISEAGCVSCDCDPVGSNRPSECNSTTGQCSCRDGVFGPRCDTCPQGTIGPSAETLLACIDCFCNGEDFFKSCSSASGWYLTETPNAIEYEKPLNLTDSDDFNEIHVKFPSTYLGDKRTAYGLNLSLSVGFPDIQFPSRGIKMKLIIYGRQRYSRVKVEKTFDSFSREIMTYQVPLIESQFEQVLYYRQPAKPELFRQALANISSMKLVIVFSPDISRNDMSVNFSSAKMLYADKNYTAALSTQPVSFVEECVCKQERKGSVCGECSEGYHFDHPFGISGEFSHCVPCFCYGYSEKCDPMSGECLDCQENRAGEDCEGCAEGFFRDPSTLECLSFCRCSGNHDRCDRASGECFCKDGYFGDECQFCDEGYFGDALQHNCADCGCNVTGTVEGTQCHLETGQCQCKPSVAGRSCDQCVSNHWGFASGAGCMACECSVTGALDTACDLVTGQCVCKDGYSGRTCDACADGYVDAGDGTCVACGCNPVTSISEVCNKRTGACQCREGVTGEKCDQCLSGTTGLLPSCEPCDECSSVWEGPVQTLEANATKYIMIADSLNVTNTTSSERLQPLLNLLEQIGAKLNSSAIDSLLNATLDVFSDLRNKITLLESLLHRAVVVEVELDGTLTEATVLNLELTQIITRLQFLVSLSKDISTQAAQLRPAFFASLVDAIREAEERSNATLQLVMTEFQPMIDEANETLHAFLSKESEFLAIVNEAVPLFLQLEAAVERYRLLVDSASRSLCGNPQGQNCDSGECGGVGCEICGGGKDCDGSLDQVLLAHTTSDMTLDEVKELVNSLMNTTSGLRQARSDSQLALNVSLEAEAKAGEARLRASNLFLDTNTLLLIVVDALSNNLSLFSLEILETIENETLLLRISKTPEGVLALLNEINSTIDQIKMVNIDTEDLRKRAEMARNTSLRANATAHEVLANLTLLRTTLEEISDLSVSAETNIISTAGKTTQAKKITAEARVDLNNLNASLSMLESTVNTLSMRVHKLMTRFDENSNKLDDVRSTVQDADQRTKTAETATTNLEDKGTQLEVEANATLDSSIEGLKEAEELRSKAESIREQAIHQLIRAERLLNRQQCIAKEQLRIQDDINRVSTELEELDQLISRHVAVNSICLYPQ